MSDTLLSQAINAHQSGNGEIAEKLYRDFLKTNPDHADACALLGVIIGSRGDFTQALQYTEQAISIDPTAALLRFHHGSVLMAAQKYQEAIASFTRAIALQQAANQPANAHFHYNYANALRTIDDWQNAIDQYGIALRLDPTLLAAYNNLALSLVHEKQYDEAFRLAQKSVTLDASYGDGWLTLCNVAEKIQDYTAALVAGERAITLQPDNHYTWFGYGVVLNRLNRDAEAITAYQRALQLNPQRADIWDNLGQSYQALNQLADAQHAYEQAVDIAGQKIDNHNPGIDESLYGNRHWHLSLIELMRGDYKNGFARYRARTKEIPALKRLTMPMPLWKGEDLRGKTLLVCDEQGYGDTMMLARFLPILRVQGTRIIFSVHKVLESYLRGWNGADEIMAHKGDKADRALPACDYYCSSFDLPHRLGITLETLPNKTPYLPILPPDAATTLPPTSKKKIGVVWGGSPLHLSDKKRSIPLSLFAELFTTPNTQFYNFNRDLKRGDAERLPTYNIENLVPRLTDFAAASRLINQMDLIITCDTATAHLAGGMGKNTWVLLPFSPDWRWLTNRTDSPWYPSARLFRQPKPEDWTSVIANAHSALKNFCQS